jgi:hypothetical protein
MNAVSIIVLMMEAAASTSETLVNFYKTTRRYNPEDSHLRSHRRENLKSYLLMLVFWVVTPCRLVGRCQHIGGT